MERGCSGLLLILEQHPRERFSDNMLLSKGKITEGVAAVV